MKSFILLLIIFGLFMSCQDVVVEKVDEFHSNKKPKIISVYIIKDNDTLKIEEKIFFEDGKLKLQGEIKNEVRDGKWVAYFNDGSTQSVGYFKNGLRDGEAKVYYPNKKLMYEGAYKEGIEVGNWKFYNEKGELVNEKNF